MHEQPSLRQVRHCKNIHHDVEEYKTLINSTRHAFISSLIETKYNSIAEIDDQLGLGTPTMPSMKELQEEKKEGQTVAANQIACAGIVRLNFSHNQDIYAPNSNQSAFNEKMMTMLRTDDKDFKELEWQFNDELGGEAGASTSFNDTAS